MNETNQVSSEAAESSCDQVTPDSNQDKSLSLMRYKDIQQLAMSLNLPGNLKHKTLVDLIKAKRSNREADVTRIIAEHRVIRKLFLKRNRESKGRQEGSEEGCDGPQPFMDASGAEYGKSNGEGSAISTRSGERPRKKRGGAPDTQTPEGAPSSSDPAQVPIAPAEVQNAYVSQMAYPYRYAMQSSPALPKSILASILSYNVSSPTLQLKSQLRSQLRCKPSSNYGIASTGTMSSTNSQFLPAETENYNNMATPQVSSKLPVSKESNSCAQEFPQGDQMYSAIHQKPQLASDGNYSTSYAVSHPSYAGLTHYPNHPIAHTHSQQPSFPQPDPGNGSNVMCFGYPQQTESSSNEAINMVEKQSVAQMYGQKFFVNQRSVDSNCALRIFNDITHKHGAHSHLPFAVSSSPGLNNNPSQCWESANVTSTSTMAQEMHKKCPSVFGNINALWHYQGMPLNYNDAPVSPSVVAHDLSVNSRNASHEATPGNFSLTNGVATHTQSQEMKSDYPDQSEARPVNSYHPPRVGVEGENSMEKSVINDGDPVTQTELNHETENALYVQQTSQHDENKVDGTSDLVTLKSVSPVETYTSNEGCEQDNNLGKQLGNCQHTVHEASECQQESVNGGLQPMSYPDEVNMSYWNNICPMMKTGHSPHYTSGFNTHCNSVYGAVPPNGNTLPCSECDFSKYSHQPTSYQTLMNPISSLSSSVESNQYNNSMAAGYGYQYGQQLYGCGQSSAYSPYLGQDNVEIDSTNNPDDGADGYLQEQQGNENFPGSYVTQNSMESMWSSTQSSSQEFDNPLVASSPVDNDLEGSQDACMGGVFPDEGDLEMEDEQGLSFPNIYDYVMSSTEGETEAGLAAKVGGKPSGEGDNSPSPGKLCDVGKGSKDKIQDGKSIEDLSDSTSEESDNTKNDNDFLPSPSKDSLNTSESSTLSEESAMTHPSNSSLESLEDNGTPISLEDNGTPVIALKRRNQPTRGKSSKVRYHKVKVGKGGSSSSPRGCGLRGKTMTRKDLISCPCDRGSCIWVGRIPTLASHIRSAHWEKVVSAGDTSYIVDVKELKQKSHSTFFQEAEGTLYMIAVHKRKEMVLTTIQSLPGSGRSGIHLNGTKASLEVLLKDGNSQGWRGRVWSILAPPIQSSQKAMPHSPVSLQERLWSRRDYLCVELNNICDKKVGGFRLYVSITPGQAHCLSSSFMDGVTTKTVSGPFNQPVEESTAASLECPSHNENVSDKIPLPPFEEIKTSIPKQSCTASSSSTTKPTLAKPSGTANSSVSEACIPENNSESKSEPTASVSTPPEESKCDSGN